jgi:hypothetical protein
MHRMTEQYFLHERHHYSIYHRAGRRWRHCKIADTRAWHAAGSRLNRNINAIYHAFVYVVRRKVSINATYIEDVILLQIESSEGAHRMWCFGLSYFKPIYQYGPFVD